MREIVLDTETTGFNPDDGDRIVEIGCLELLNHMPTGRTYHQYINPERSMPAGAFSVHGIGPDLLDEPRAAKKGEVLLKDKPKFAEIADDFLSFVEDSKLVIHNAKFDMKFLNAELSWVNKPTIEWSRAIDTLAMARTKFPGAQASLDALCRRFAIDNTSRVLHGALLDSEILAEVYLELIGGRQPDFALSMDHKAETQAVQHTDWKPRSRPTSLPSRLTEAEIAAHEEFVNQLGDNAMWKKPS